MGKHCLVCMLMVQQQIDIPCGSHMSSMTEVLLDAFKPPKGWLKDDQSPDASLQNADVGNRIDR